MRKSRGENKSESSNKGDPRGRSRSTDTPEIIAAKRAARKAKREKLLALEGELRKIEQALEE